MSDIAIAEMLLNRGANNQPEKQFVPPFAAACEYATAEMVEFLASRGANVNPLDKHGIHPLTLVCYNHFAGEEIIDILIHAGAEPTPNILTMAFRNDVFYVMAQVADPTLWRHVSAEIGHTRHSNTTETLLHVAARTNKAYAVVSLMKRFVNPHIINESQQRAVDLVKDGIHSCPA